MKKLSCTIFASVEFALLEHVMYHFHTNFALVNVWTDSNFKALTDRKWCSFLHLKWCSFLHLTAVNLAPNPVIACEVLLEKQYLVKIQLVSDITLDTSMTKQQCHAYVQHSIWWQYKVVTKLQENRRRNVSGFHCVLWLSHPKVILLTPKLPHQCA